MDNTCKLWSVSSYQREPSAVQQELQESKNIGQKLDSYIDVTEEAYDIQIKLKDFSGLKVGEIFNIKAHTKEEDLPSYWHKQEIQNAIAEAKKPEESSEEEEEAEEEEEGVPEDELPKSTFLQPVDGHLRLIAMAQA
ncbi:hypothetical protein HDV00_001533 [Rhizophlyctis rosea]|nr:hypothetical protein HDV00_001533 [Rhizophlyctis rosea]